MVYRMKITAIIPDKLIKRTNKLAGGANTTESLIIALREWVASKELSGIVKTLRKKPLQFAAIDIGSRVRAVNRDSE